MKIINARASEIENSYLNNFTDLSKEINITDDTVLLLNCSHTVKHKREDSEVYKYAESYVGVLIEDLISDVNSSFLGGIYKTSNIDDDPNYNSVSPYRNRVLNLVDSNKIKYILDIHISSECRPFELEIGSDFLSNVRGDKELINKIFNILENTYGNKIYIDEIFKAGLPNNLNKFIVTNSNNKFIKSIQLEINFKNFKDIERYNQLKFTLKEIINYLLKT